MIKIYVLLALIFVMGCDNSLRENEVLVKKNIQGETMGTTYHVSYFSSLQQKNVKLSIDSLLFSINSEVSTFIPTSTISKFNTSKEKSIFIPRTKTHFWSNYLAAKKIFKDTDGFFDPTVMPLVNYWGFGYKGHQPVENVDSTKIDSILQFVGFDKIFVRKDSIFKKHLNSQLDFSACAKGYAIDKIAHWFDSEKVSTYYIEIGGENRAKGRKPNGKLWTVGLVIPKEESGEKDYQTIIELDNKSMATSGNYRNFHKVKGQKYSHTIHPKTGFSERNSILSASVLTTNCLKADALATGIMAMGYSKAKKLYKSLDSVQIILKIGQTDGTIKTEFWGVNPLNKN